MIGRDIRWSERVDFTRIDIFSDNCPTLWRSEQDRRKDIAPNVKAAKKQLRKWGCKSAELSDETTVLGAVTYYHVVGRMEEEISFREWGRR